MNCEEFTKLLKETLPSLYECREDAGRLKIRTPAEHPDGDYVEVYLMESEEGLILSDLGETLRILLNYNFDIGGTPKRKKLFERILRNYGIHYYMGELRAPIIEDHRMLGKSIFNIVQAITEVSNLLFTSRIGAVTVFKEDVEDFLIEKEIKYMKSYSVSGRSGAIYSVDYYIEAIMPSLIEALSSGSISYADTLVSKTVRMWYDIKRLNGRFKFITLIDDSADIWKPAHYDLLGDLSNLVVWSERDEIISLVRES